METATPHRTLIVANLTASTPFLLQEVKRLASERPTSFSLLIPNSQQNSGADWSIATATKLIGRAAGANVDGHVGGQDAFESIKAEIAGGQYDDILISTLPKRRSEWLRKDLPTRVETLGLPVNVITPPEEPSGLQQFTDTFSAKTSG
ncbi:MAG: hypothetical protein WAN22_29440 [Solirubrobacteraceae bacterium]